MKTANSHERSAVIRRIAVWLMVIGVGALNALSRHAMPASYDCTSQQLIDSGTVVINGERSGLDLLLAEGEKN